MTIIHKFAQFYFEIDTNTEICTISSKYKLSHLEIFPLYEKDGFHFIDKPNIETVGPNNQNEIKFRLHSEYSYIQPYLKGANSTIPTTKIYILKRNDYIIFDTKPREE